MTFSLSRLANAPLLITSDFLNEVITDSIMNRNKTFPSLDCSKIRPLEICSGLEHTDVSNDLSSVNSENDIIFYHSIKGLILSYQTYGYDYGTWEWVKMFATKTFVDNLKTADASANVIAHFLHINSGGGEAWMLDVAAAAMRECKKPIYAFVERQCCSAAYYLAANANVIKAYTQNDSIGSIGVMTSGLDLTGYYEQMGIKKIEVYATKSTLKNKTERDMIDGKPEEFITTRLDPQQAQFETSVRTAREQLSKLPDDHPALQGQTYFAIEAIEIGLIDGLVADLGTALGEAYELGIATRKNNQLLTNI